MPDRLHEATERQPAARAALAAALAASPSHAYLFAGPGGAQMSTVARAFAAELLADGAPDPESARRRALAEPSPHPDLVWLRPPGAQHLVEEVREQVIRNVAYRPFEGERRVFVIEFAEAMADESQNALLRTLEEPPPFAHLLLLSSEPEGLLATVTSRLQEVRFMSLTPEALEQLLRDQGETAGDDAVRAAARLAGGDAERARFLLSERGIELRGAIDCWAAAVGDGELADAPWNAVLALAEAAGSEQAEAVERELSERGAAAGGAAAKRAVRDGQAAGRHAGRRRRTEVLDLALGLLGTWFRDLAATAEGAGDLALASDRTADLEAAAAGVEPRRARRATELTLEARRRLRVNVSEELALEALSYRAEYLLRAA
ncbi:MAG: ATP-binding protein [Solirubrobacterales bacterium]